ncbi:TonB-dependent receptor plug domain-containing protein [Caulobacter mirabilis]|uniref:TonB-dependent receptor n=1 Tax=Caulobacter mirabilis TaxID=69666 RepID=A0A2D2B2Y4_9CAUL|nr:TonB-dependent receptor [Caulobacter mirabilis]ATQ44611.1 hypothetical protein CSW64_20550 [Caulobacter mirabilis]
MSLKHFLLASALGASCGLAVPALALAQEAPPAAQPETLPKPDHETAEAVEAVVITGSRIRRSDFTSSSPITIITSEEAALEGVSTAADLLQNLPQATTSQQINTLLGGFAVTGGPGVQTLGLRGLGASRTLVLLNGRRLGPAGVGGSVGSVDLNVLPQMALEQIEILKDGASSIYGSDAVAGVVNYITKTNMDGLTVNAYANIPQHGGGEVYTLNAAYGKTLPKGYIAGSFSYTEDKGLTHGDRRYTACAEDYITDINGKNRVDFRGADGGFKCSNTIGNSVVEGRYFGGYFQYDPKLENYPNYPAAGLNLRAFLPDWVRAGRGGQVATQPYFNTTSPLYDQQHVRSPRTLLTGLFNASYDLTPTTTAYAEVLFNRRESSFTGMNQLFPNLDPNNPTNTMGAGLRAACGFVGYSGSLPVCRVNGQFVPGTDGRVTPIILRKSESKQTVDYAHAVLGLRGTVSGLGFLDGFKWDSYYEYTASRADYTQDFVYKDRVTAATGVNEANEYVSNGLACNPAQMTVAPTACLTIPWLDPRVLRGDFTAQERAFLFGNEKGRTSYDRHSFEANLSGDLFRLPAGPLSVAAGVAFRSDRLKDTPGEQAVKRNYWGFSTAGVTKGTENVGEAYVEFLAPVVKNLPVAESVDLSASARFSNYDDFGSHTTYKVGLDWALSSEYRFRGSVGTSFRAPALYERYLADSTSFFNGNDPCTRWGESSNSTLRARCGAAGVPDDYGGFAATPQVFTGGGAKLTPETSKAISVGAVWTPANINLKVALDYFSFDVRDQVDNYGASNILNGCYGSNINPEVYCKLLVRDPITHDVVRITDNYVNISRQVARGVDLGINFSHTFTSGTLNIDSQTTWQAFVAQSAEGERLTNYTGTLQNPEFTSDTNVSFRSGDNTYYWSVSYIGESSNERFFETGEKTLPSANYPQGYTRKLHKEAMIYHTVSYRRRFDKTTLWVGVNNLFDEAPPAISSDIGGRAGISLRGSSDFLGRRFFIQLERKF